MSQIRRRMRHLPWYSLLVAAVLAVEVILYLIPVMRPFASRMTAGVYWLLAHDRFRR